MITFDDVTHFNTFGYIAQRQLFSADEVAQLREEFDAVLAKDFPQFDNSQSVDSTYICDRAEGLLKTLPVDDRIYDIPLKVLGHDFQYEGSGGHWHVGDTPWHGGSGVQHWPLPHIKVSLYLDELKTGAGELRVIPGSHHNYQPHHLVDRPDSALNREIDADDINDRDAVTIELAAGQVSLHDSGIVHGAAANRSARRRAGLALRYMPATSQVHRKMPNAAADWCDMPIELVRGRNLHDGTDFTLGEFGRPWSAS